MITSKKTEIITMIGIVAALVFSLFLMKNMQAGNISVKAASEPDYVKMLFDTEKPMTIDIVMDPGQWKDMLDNASKKKWYSCDVVINGTRFKNVGIRIKGDASLESIANNPNSNRYSFKLRFDKYVDNQKCFGLDKLCLNNSCGDSTNMKEALVYDMFQSLDAPAPLYNFASIRVNNEYWGCYLALEAADKSFLERNYGTQTGALYKPGESSEPEDEEWDESEEMSEEYFGNGANELLGGGADLKYIDDNIDSYFAIWAAQVTKTDDTDRKRVVEALKHISNKDSLEQYMDIDTILKYMAVHNFSVNLDSLIGDGDHNYYLHEKDGKLSILPWDYNLCFGAYTIEFSNENDALYEGTAYASTIVNYPIDDHWAITSFFDGILDNEEYLARYHEYYKKLIDQYVLGEGFNAFYSRTRTNIDELVKTDPNALYSYDEYVAGAEMLKKTVNLRGLSVRGQLEGTIPPTAEKQKETPEKLINAESINIWTMGSDM